MLPFYTHISTTSTTELIQLILRIYFLINHEYIFQIDKILIFQVKSENSMSEGPAKNSPLNYFIVNF